MLKEVKRFCIVSSTWYLTAALVSASASLVLQQTSTSTTTTTSTTPASTSTTSTTSQSKAAPLYQTDVIVTRAPHVIGVVTAEIYRRVTPDCSVDACSDTALSVDLARSLIHCASMCSQSPKCLYYRTIDYKETLDPRDKICYLYGLPPTVTENSYKFLGQA